MDKKSEQLLQDVIFYKDKIWALVYSIIRDYHISQDTLQEICVFIVSNPEKYDSSKKFLPWALGVARFKSFEAVRKAQKQLDLIEDDVLDKIQDDLSDFNRDEESRISALEECLDEVSEDHQKILMMKYVDKLTAEAIAEKIKRTPIATYSLLQRTRIIISNCIRRKLVEE
ncbi:MAG: sigma-70 family RNA polymerase sigma factor [Lentisphaeraceae bacterium]|nr:sigma-70 family RNA polymerase sigma factor [Lentisphaeraceae bacterium]